MTDDNSSEQGPEMFGDDEQLQQIIARTADSQPTKQKVKVFKTRLLSLLLRFVEKAKDVAPLIEALSQQTFLKEPERARQIVHSLLNKQNISPEQLTQLRNYYQVMLLYKSRKDSNKYADDYVKMLRKSKTDEEAIKREIGDMVEIFLSKRKCTLRGNFFMYLARKIPNLKKVIVAKCEEVEQSQRLRASQLKQAHWLKEKLSKKTVVKEEMEQELQEE